MSATVSTRLGRVLGATRPLSEFVAMLRLLSRLGSDLVTSIRRGSPGTAAAPRSIP